MGCGGRGGSRDAVPDALRVPSRGDGREWADRRAPVWLPDLPAARRGAVFALDGSAYFSRPGSAGHRRDRAAGRDHRSRRVRRYRAARELDAGPGSVSPTARAMPFRPSFACLWCGTAHTCRTPDDLEGWAQLCPDCVGKAGDNEFLRFRLRQALTERAAPPARATRPSATAPAEPAAAARRDRGTRRAPPRPTTWSPTTRRARPSTTTGTCAAVATPVARSTMRRGTPRSTGPGAGWTACRWPAGSSSSRRERAGGRRCSPARASCRSTTRRRRRWIAPASASSRIACAPTSTSATRGPTRTPVADGLFTGFWLSHVERARLGEFLGAGRGAGCDRAGATPSSTRCPIRPSGAADHPVPADDRAVRRLDDGREFTIVKVYYTPEELAAALAGAGFRGHRGDDDRPVLRARDRRRG